MIRKHNWEKGSKSGNVLKICIFLVAALFFVGHANAEIGPWCEGPNEDNVKVCKSIYPTVISPDGTAELRLNVSWPVEKGANPADIVFAIDSSGSTKRIPVPLDKIKEESKRVVDRMILDYHRAAVVSWDEDIDFTQGLTNDFTLVNQRIDEAESVEHELTYFCEGLRGAITVLDESPNTDSNARRVIVFLTDAKEEYKPCPELVEEAKNKGYKLYTIGPLPNEDLETMARDTRGKPYDIKDLGEAYDEITELELFPITQIADITITDVLHNYLTVGDDSFSVYPTTGPIQNPDGTTIMVWNVSEEEVEREYWESSFDVVFARTLPVDVTQTYRDQTLGTNDISIVTYTMERTPKSIYIPTGNIALGCPTLTDGNISILSVSTTLSPPNPSEGQRATITAVIKNVGNKEVRDVKVGFYADEQLVGTGYVDVVKPGGVEIRKVDWNARKGAKITARVDSFSPVSLTPTQTQTPTSITPGFEAVFAIAAIAGLLAVAYLVRRKKSVK